MMHIGGRLPVLTTYTDSKVNDLYFPRSCSSCAPLSVQGKEALIEYDINEVWVTRE